MKTLNVIQFVMLFVNLIFSGLNRTAFDNKTVSFEEHVKCEHNMWHYLYFIVLVKVKDPTEFTGPESYVYAMVKVL
jgi:inositol 1,4,5-triphosphate receptor type 1